MIAEILFAVAWKSVAVAAGVVAILILMGRQTPANRVAVGGLGFGLLLLLPAIAMLMAFRPVAPIELVAPSMSSMTSTTELLAMADVATAPESETFLSLVQLLVLSWAAGALFVALRLAGGLATLARWTDRAGPVVGPQWRAIARRCNVPDHAHLLASSDVSAPLSWGWRNPVILIDLDTLLKPVEAEAVVAHEVAHLTRGDWPRLIAVRLVVALFWFNPFVWALERLYLQSVEEAADAAATGLVEPAHYAQALLNAARNASVPIGANSISSGSLAKRIQRVLRRNRGSRWDKAWRVGALASCALVAGSIALVQIVAPAVSAAVPAPLPMPETIDVARPASAASALTQTVRSTAAMAATPAKAVVAPVASSAPTAPLAAVAAVAPLAPKADLIDREEIERITRASEEMRVQSRIIARDSQKNAERARAEAAIAMTNARQGMLKGADEMDRGAIEMRQGAARMREEARKLRDPAYRAQVIAEAKANRGKWGNSNWNDKVPTDQELIDAIPKMDEGARKMDEGVEKMREGARKMRESAQRH